MTPEEQKIADREELDRLVEKRFLISRRINKLRKNMGLPKEAEPPRHHCKRCDYEWVGRIVHRLPTSCPRCHSALWDEEPAGHKRTYKPARRPEDPPNPNWATNWGKNEKKNEVASASVTTLPPPPRSTSSSTGFPRPRLSEQLAAKLQEPVKSGEQGESERTDQREETSSQSSHN